MRCRNFPHNRQAKPAAGAGGAVDAVEAFQHLLALRRRNAGPVVFNLKERMVIARTRPHGDAAARGRVFQRVVDQVAERLAQQQRVPRNLHVVQLRRPRSMSFAIARCTHSSAASSTTARRFTGFASTRVPPGSARASASSWLARRAVRMVARCICSSCTRCSSGTPCASAISVCACRPASGVRSWCAALARKRCWLLLASATCPNSWFSAPTSGAASLGCVTGIDRAQVARRARADFARQILQRRQAALDAEPDQRERRQRDEQFRHQAGEHDVCARACGACWWFPPPAPCRSGRRRAPAARSRESAGRGRWRRRRSRRPPALPPGNRRQFGDRLRAPSRPGCAGDSRSCPYLSVRNTCSAAPGRSKATSSPALRMRSPSAMPTSTSAWS